MKRKNNKRRDVIENLRNQNFQSPDDEAFEVQLVQRFEEESNKIVLTDAAIIKAEQIKGDQTQTIY